MQVVPDLIRNPASRFPDRPCVVEGQRTLTFADVDRRADQLAAALLARGVGPGDRIALLALNEPEYVEIQVACQRAGVILAPLNYRLAVPELAYILGDCGARLLIHGPGYDVAAKELGIADTLHLGPTGHGEPYEAALAEHHDPPRRGPLDAAAPATILYTSGTTGRPKGAVLTNLAVYARCSYAAIEMEAAPGSVFVQTLPMFHIAANLAYSVHVQRVDDRDDPGVLGRRDGASPPRAPRQPRAARAHHDQHDLQRPRHRRRSASTHLRMVLYGASPIAPDVLRRAIQVFRCDFLQFFGMTETAGCALLRPADHDPDGRPDLLAAAGTDGISFETRVVDPDDITCPPGVVGEIVTRGPCVMDGYWNNPEASAEALRNGWMHTGDLGYRSDEGYLFVTDR